MPRESQEIDNFRSLDNDKFRLETKNPRGHLSLQQQNTLFLKRVEGLEGSQGIGKEPPREAVRKKDPSQRGSQEYTKRDSVGSYLDAIESLSDKNFMQVAKESLGWLWRKGVKSVSGKNFMRLMLYGLIMSKYVIGVEGVKIQGKNGCVIDSELIIDEHPSSYDNANRIVRERFNMRIGDILPRYAENPCDRKYEKFFLTFVEDMPSGQLGFTDVLQKHIFLEPKEQVHEYLNRTLGGSFIHEFAHGMQELAGVDVDPNHPSYNYLNKLRTLLAELRSEYTVVVYGSDQDIKNWAMPPNLEQTAHYSDLWGCKHGGYFMVWLDQTFPGFMDNIINLSRKKPLELKDCEQFTNGQSLDTR